MALFPTMCVCTIAALAGESIDHDFYHSQFNLDWLEYEGRGAFDAVKPTDTGLRITLPPPPGATDWIFGVRPRVQPSGDFTITADFRIDAWHEPEQRNSIGVVIYIVERSKDEAASISFGWHHGIDRHFTVHKVNVVEGKRKQYLARHRAEGDRVVLRLQREGDQLHYYVQPEGSYEFRRLGTRPFAGGDIRKIRIGAQNSKSREPITASLRSITIEADELRGLYRGEPPDRSGWWITIGVAAFLIAALVGVAIVRQRRTAS